MLSKEHEKIITETYNKYRKPFICFAERNHALSKEDSEDIYQDAMIAFHQNVINGKIDILTVPLQSYVFAIGINKIRDHYRKKYKIAETSNHPEILSSDDEMHLYFFEKEEDAVSKRNMVIYNTVSQMENPCKKILSLVYWHKKSMKEIAEQMNYSSPDVAKSQKSRCMRKIETVITKKLKEAELM